MALRAAIPCRPLLPYYTLGKTATNVIVSPETPAGIDEAGSSPNGATAPVPALPVKVEVIVGACTPVMPVPPVV